MRGVVERDDAPRGDALRELRSGPSRVSSAAMANLRMGFFFVGLGAVAEVEAGSSCRSMMGIESISRSSALPFAWRRASCMGVFVPFEAVGPM